MTPEQFWQTTPAELQALTDGYQWRQERTLDYLAWLAAHLINIHQPRGRKITPMDLRRKQRVGGKEEAFQALWDKVQRRRKGGDHSGDAG